MGDIGSWGVASPLVLRQIVLVLGSATAGAAVFLILRQISVTAILPGGPGRAIALYSAPNSQAPSWTVDDVYRALGITPPRHAVLMQAGAFGLTFFLLIVMSYPWPLAAGAGALAFLLARSFLQNRRTQARVRIEQELPSFVSEIAGQLMVTSSARLVLEEVITGMRYASSLRAWMQYLLYGYNREGVIFLGQARREAQTITPHLGVVMYELERLAETGGGDFAAAFTTSADELSAILEARAVAGSKAESARMAVLMLMGIMGFVLFTMFSSDAIREGFNYPAVQMITVGCVVVMGFGYSFMNDMINEAMEG
jgi:hypothetical protein